LSRGDCADGRNSEEGGHDRTEGRDHDINERHWHATALKASLRGTMGAERRRSTGESVSAEAPRLALTGAMLRFTI